MMIELGENRYGKSRVRLVRVKRDPERHDLREWTLQVLLEGDYESCFRDGDNSKILPTDTLKNTVYWLARKSQAACMEDFAKELIDFLLARNPQILSVEIKSWEKIWERVVISGRPHPTAFVQSSAERATTRVQRSQSSRFLIVSGLENLIMMKTAGSGFEGYIQDSLTTLAPTRDRLLGTCLSATWEYAAQQADFERLRGKLRTLMLEAFACHDSKSVQHTLYAMGERVLNEVGEVQDIELTMPNIHCLPVDLSAFGEGNPNEVFMPIDEPHGYIQARLHRQGTR
jgi:urate oxidase